MHLCMLGHSCAGWSKNKPGFSPETACAVCPIWLLHCSQRAWVELTRLQDMLRGLFLSNNESQEIWISTTFSLRHPRAWVQTIVFIGLTDDKIVTEVWFCSSTCFVTVYVQKRLQMISQEWLIPVNVLFLYNRPSNSGLEYLGQICSGLDQTWQIQIAL